MIGPADLCALIAEGRFALAKEKLCQAEIAAHLAARLPAGCLLSREHRLGPYDIPDFVVDGRIVVEVKMNGAQWRAVQRQLERYAAYAAIDALVLVTNRAMSLGPAIGGKPLLTVSLGRAWL